MGDSDIHELWREITTEELREELDDRWEANSRARVLMLLARAEDGLTAPDIVRNTGVRTDWLCSTLGDLQRLGVVEGCDCEPPRYRLSQERAVLRYVAEFAGENARAASRISMLARMASE